MHTEHDERGADTIVIRGYMEADWPTVCAVHDRARPEELRGSCDPRAFVPLAEEKEDAADFHRSRKHVACLGEQIVGFVGVDGEYISWLYVDPAYSGRGIGRQLLRFSMEHTGPSAWTVLLDGNLRARNLYESEGFRHAGTFEGTNAGYPCICLKMAVTP